MSINSEYRIDFVTLVFRNDSEYFQNEVAPSLGAYHMMALEHDSKAKPAKVIIRGGLSGKDSYYVVQCWGALADRLAYFMPTAWWERAIRIDWRKELPTLTREDVMAWSIEQQRAGLVRANFTSYTKQDSQKNDKRGAGGCGGLLGSWKSGLSISVYARRREVPAINSCIWTIAFFSGTPCSRSSTAGTSRRRA